MRIAVVGGGVAGIVSSYLLQQEHDVVIFEKNDYLGGHTNTKVVPDGPDEGTAVDTGFIVLNSKNYPLLHEFFARLGVPVRKSDMSFSYYSEGDNIQYAGTTLNGLFAKRSNLLPSRFWWFLVELAGFCRNARADIGSEKSANRLAGLTLGEYIRERNISAYLRDHYLLPMGAAIWSASLDEILSFPARSFLQFFENHGLLRLKDRPQWQTVIGGSSSYVERFRESFEGAVWLNRGVSAVQRNEDGVEIVDLDGYSEKFDHVVMACHADQALALLEEPSAQEKKLLGAWSYQRNHTVLHTDTKLLPPLRRAWASWNYLRLRHCSPETPVAVTYHMNTLQGLKTAKEYCVSLNGGGLICDSHVLYQTTYQHPVFSQEAVATQQKLSTLNGMQRTHFCGSYFGYGFHEDAVRSAVAVAESMGISFDKYKKEQAGSHTAKRAVG